VAFWDFLSGAMPYFKWLNLYCSGSCDRSMPPTTRGRLISYSSEDNMGLMDSNDIQYVWKAIQESERSDEDLCLNKKEASARERAVTKHLDVLSGQTIVTSPAAKYQIATPRDLSGLR
jgi:hypothetical protein